MSRIAGGSEKFSTGLRGLLKKNLDYTATAQVIGAFVFVYAKKKQAQIIGTMS